MEASVMATGALLVLVVLWVFTLLDSSQRGE